MNRYSNKYQLRDDDELKDEIEKEFERRMEDERKKNPTELGKDKEKINIVNDEKLVSSIGREVELSKTDKSLDKSDIGKDTDRSVSNLLKNEISTKSGNLSTNTKENAKCKTPVANPLDIMKKKIEVELRKRPEFKKKHVGGKFDTVILIF
jgi:hypothetical protein